MEGLIVLIVYLIIYCLVVGVLLWVVQMLLASVPIAPWIKQVIIALLVLVAVLIAVRWFMANDPLADRGISWLSIIPIYARRTMTSIGTAIRSSARRRVS